ncbi:structure-specific endonuclease subunit slx1 isoform X2 [Palaemon carinicauda]|uniref:structure-specific endonuclease subunit slx1 isoform X2 n=2 Tax=Palaemon carinicauda TaxID=392227 RepID=UPI0035B58888
MDRTFQILTRMSQGEVVEDFYGVYLLYCINPKYRGRTYIGFTVDPNRRIKQHNTGVKAGGAYRTSNKGPWEMVLIVHGFPNDISALRFEWAWQHPEKSRRLRNVDRKKSSEKRFDFCLRVLATMLQTKPWARLPLTLRWLKQEYMKEFPVGMEAPLHMPIAYGPVKPQKVSSPVKQDSSVDSRQEFSYCVLCEDLIKSSDLMRCLKSTCKMTAHVRCLAHHMLKDECPDTLLPLEGLCPICNSNLLWGDLVRLKRGCYRNSEDLEEHWAESLTNDDDSS